LISCENHCNWTFKINYCFIAIIMVNVVAICVYIELWDNLFLIKWVFFFYKIYLMSHSIIERSHISHTSLTILHWEDLKPLRHHKKGYRHSFKPRFGGRPGMVIGSRSDELTRVNQKKTNVIFKQIEWSIACFHYSKK
jgi:hypothetical protein